MQKEANERQDYNLPQIPLPVPGGNNLGNENSSSSDQLAQNMTAHQHQQPSEILEHDMKPHVNEGMYGSNGLHVKHEMRGDTMRSHHQQPSPSTPTQASPAGHGGVRMSNGGVMESSRYSMGNSTSHMSMGSASSPDCMNGLGYDGSGMGMGPSHYSLHGSSRSSSISSPQSLIPNLYNNFSVNNLIQRYPKM